MDVASVSYVSIEPTTLLLSRESGEVVASVLTLFSRFWAAWCLFSGQPQSSKNIEATYDIDEREVPVRAAEAKGIDGGGAANCCDGDS